MAKNDDLSDVTLTIGDSAFYFDMDTLNDFIIAEPKNEKTPTQSYITRTYDSKGGLLNSEHHEEYGEDAKEVNAPKYEIIRQFIDTVLNEMSELDDTLGTERALNNASLSFKMSFNTLTKYGIIKEIN